MSKNQHSSGKKTEQFNMRFTDEQRGMLDKLAKHYSLNHAECIRMLVTQAGRALYEREILDDSPTGQNLVRQMILSSEVRKKLGMVCLDPTPFGGKLKPGEAQEYRFQFHTEVFRPTRMVVDDGSETELLVTHIMQANIIVYENGWGIREGVQREPLTLKDCMREDTLSYLMMTPYNNMIIRVKNPHKTERQFRAQYIGLTHDTTIPV